ncbi:MAG: rhodanese-related sulfurtransferase [Pigeon pea little leaf phytoplasma]|uniref:tRNA uridine(34) hydroxylase n=1 Tax=Candidatus Phytoplasma fabacearum TaxID=2982628 RepID=A0ABU8ZSJ7_9MOLU|nr:rhodanese-related sulfurtransferase ['Bituminaria bituminosa' little leaf phytoplasma]MDV3158175.1 rhodanese-related sulfurtransferase [Pigeon pea little leaf phytoplasma]MDO8023821.1 rhodanese-related sulfurtransferase ['Bituminaria bituminosa' little leaf phytoplasma]MDV3158418.1 rhodanese-related sulfurtransferase [Pigeon pea little leaf phytoplasma]MDV3161409.1 rhodanese-related sulfurtransferase [Pigeon pea little leaf phytoplasma]MDV3163196.1 rhodanese-related sulfurtransferase [Pigeo
MISSKNQIDTNLYQVILFYNYNYIKNPQNLCDLHKTFCIRNKLLGRIIISDEGINGTLSGLIKDINSYMKFLLQDSCLANTAFKIDSVKDHVFPKLSVKYKKEIVSFKLINDIFPKNSCYLEPKDFYYLSQKSDIILLDARNNYETKLGNFLNAILPDINNFRELPAWIDKNLDLFANKTVLTYCTGGVRCEKLSVYLKDKGISEVFQLKGGIINYSQDKEIQGERFQGSLYVFDKRIAVKVNKKRHTIIGKDFFDQTPCERYINCSNPECNKQILCSLANEIKYSGSCCLRCRQHTHNRFNRENHKKSINVNNSLK